MTVTVKDKLRKTWKTLVDSPRAKRTQKIIRKIIIAAIFGIIVYQLFLIGWDEVLRSLPTQPLFYILFFVLYATLPTAEVFIYRQVWPVKKLKLFKTLLSKKITNDEVMGYSGEFYLLMWARKYLDKRDTEILKDVRDNNILSAVTSNLVVFSLVGILIYSGVINISELVGNVNLVYVTAGVIIAAVFVALFFQFRRYLFSLPPKKALVIFSIYMTRFLIHHGLLIVQWSIVIPQTSLSTWFTFLAITIVVNRIPLLPSRDLIFVWAGIELSRVLNMTTASVAGMLLVSSALKKCTNLILLLILSYYSDAPKTGRFRKESQLNELATNESQ